MRTTSVRRFTSAVRARCCIRLVIPEAGRDASDTACGTPFRIGRNGPRHRHRHVGRVPFALAAGLSGAVSTTSIVVTAGLAEIAAGSIAMGLGGYLAARSDAEHYDSERRREQDEVRDIPAAETREVTDLLAVYGVSAEAALPLCARCRNVPRRGSTS